MCRSSVAPAIAGAIPSTYTVTFFENDNVSDNTSAYQLGTCSPRSHRIREPKSCVFKLGYTFDDWNTSTERGWHVLRGRVAIFVLIRLVPLCAVDTGTELSTPSPSSRMTMSATTRARTNTGTSAQDLTAFANLSPAFSNSGYTFDDWNTSPNGGGTSYADESQYSFSSDLSLYAQWTANASVTAAFSNNGGSGSVSSVQDPSGTTITLPPAGDLTRIDFTLTGWNTLANGNGTEYAPGGSVVLTSNETFYAQWTETSPHRDRILNQWRIRI